MRICLVSHEYPPFPGGGIATYAEAAGRHLAEAGHEVHVVTNRASFGSKELVHTVDFWRHGNLSVHRLDLFDVDRKPSPSLRFFDVDPLQYPDHWELSAYDPSNIAAAAIAGFVASLHAVVQLDVIEVPEYYAEAFYIVRQRNAGRRHRFPPVCVIGHTSTRELLAVSKHTLHLGRARQREMMLREEYCLQHADGLQTPSRSLLSRYEASFGAVLPERRKVIPYYLDLPDVVAELPAELRGEDPYILAVGRIEPRKGSDLLARAFAAIAAEYPRLKLVFLGREAWRAGETFADVLRREIAPSARDRVLCLGNVARGQALAAAARAAAFVHAAPWDNFPSAVLEAMSVGARCVVSDHGGQAEMIEDCLSGLVFSAGDPQSLAQALRRVLGDHELGQSIAAAAVRRVRAITDPLAITASKVELFQAMVDDERVRRELDPDVEPAFPPVSRNGFHSQIPGHGLLVVDAEGAAEALQAVTFASVDQEVAQASGWRLTVLVDGQSPVAVPAGWSALSAHAAAPWRDLAPDDCVVWIRAGTRFDHGALRRLVRLTQNSPTAAAVFAWLRPATIERFPYAHDGGLLEFVVEGAVLPTVLAFSARHADQIGDLLGLETPAARICGLICVLTLLTRGSLIHTGDVEGDYYESMPLVTRFELERALGFAEVRGLLPRELLTTHRRGTSFVAEFSPARLATAAASAHELASVQQALHSAQLELQELRRIRDEHFRLKHSPLARLLRKLRIFELARKVVPGSRRVLGDGKQS